MLTSLSTTTNGQQDLWDDSGLFSQSRTSPQAAFDAIDIDLCIGMLVAQLEYGQLWEHEDATFAARQSVYPPT